jgi:hypothetical protein
VKRVEHEEEGVDDLMRDKVSAGMDRKTKIH